LDIEELKRQLPVAYPYLLIDRVDEREPDRVVARKCVSANEPYFPGHFRAPYPSVMPGTMILEGMAQTAGLLLQDGRLGYLASVDRARFHRSVVPGDVLVFRATAVRRRTQLVRTEVVAEVEGARVAEARITVMEAADVGQDC